jgi:sterol desaturase/sphingolipid hydroxylase (fatty acid hydroxylase superfamily)
MTLLQAFCKTFAFIFTAQSLRYLFFAGGAFYLVKRASGTWLNKHRVQKSHWKQEDLKREIIYSLMTILMHGVTFALVLNPEMRQHTKIYLDAKEYGWSWFILSLPVLILIHDTYFYWMHRLLHHPWFYLKTHKVHHLSTNPSPLAAQAFHPFEACFELFWIVPILFLIPYQTKILLTFSFFTLIYNVYGHLSVEIFPNHWSHHPVLKWLNTSAHHNRHHQFFKGNYGLYFLFWDRWMRTELIELPKT